MTRYIKLFFILIWISLISTFILLVQNSALADGLGSQWNENGFAIKGNVDYAMDAFYFKFSPYWATPASNGANLGIGEAYADWNISDSFGLSLGRKMITFGPGRYGFPALGPLVPYPGNHFETDYLNNSYFNWVAEGYDQIGYHFTWGNLKYQKFYANVSEDSFRMLLGQRAAYDWGPFTFGASETALVNKDAPALFYLPVPFVPVYFYQWYANRYMHMQGINGAANMAVDFDLTWHPTQNFKIYGEYYMDDRPWPRLDSNWQFVTPEWDKWWWKCGYQAGLEWDRAFNKSDLTLYAEYTRIDQYTYTSWHPGDEWVPGLDWTYRGRMIGDALGPDADRLNVELKWDPSPEWQWNFSYIREQHGEGQIGDHWKYVPGQTVVFLTGVVETSDALFVTARRKFDNSSLGATIGLIQTGNARHQAGVNEFYTSFGVDYTVRF